MASTRASEAKRAPSLAGHKGPVLCLDINPSQTLLASASEDNTVRIWSLETRKCLHVCLPEKTLGIATASTTTEDADDGLSLAKFVSDYVVLVAFGGNLILYNLDTNDIVITKHSGKVYLEKAGEVNSIDISSGSKILVSCDEGVVELDLTDISASKEASFPIIKQHTAYVTCGRYKKIPDSKDLKIITGGFDSKVFLYDSKKQVTATFDFNDNATIVEGNVKQMFNPPYIHGLILLNTTGTWAASATGNGSIEILHLETQFRAQPIEAHSSATAFIDLASFSPSVFVSAGNDGAIGFWDFSMPDEATSTKFGELTTRRRQVAAKMKISKTALAPQKKLVASLDSQIKALNAAPTATIRLKIEHGHKINWIATTKTGAVFVGDTQDSITCYSVSL